MSPMSTWPEEVVFLEEWAPPQDWEGVEMTPGAVVEALNEIEKSLKKQDAHQLMVVAAVGWLFLSVKKGH